MRRALLSWTLVIAFIAAGFGASVLALNGDVFSAHGFVRSYLETLARKDSAGALAFAGVAVPANESRLLLQDAALGDIDDIQFLSDDVTNAVHTVRFSYRFTTGRETSEFTVKHAGTRLALFDTWQFADSPLASLAVTVLHDSRFNANGVQANGDDTYAVFRPGLYDLGHTSKYLSARTVAVAVTDPGTQKGEVDVEANDSFDAASTKAVGSFLDDCATQQVLMPTGCPFGYEEPNRIDGLPQWSMVDYPTVKVAASDTIGSWTATGQGAVANIKVVVRSLFDGSTSKLDKNVDFEASYRVVVGADNSLTVSAEP